VDDVMLELVFRNGFAGVPVKDGGFAILCACPVCERLHFVPTLCLPPGPTERWVTTRTVCIECHNTAVMRLGDTHLERFRKIDFMVEAYEALVRLGLKMATARVTYDHAETMHA